MAHPLFYRDKYFFYPIGNTAAVSLSRDVLIDEDANLLLLGCGDVRNVLYTVYCEPSQGTRRFDFTCCDFDPAVLARNILLFSLVLDKIAAPTIWNIFFHFMIDSSSHDALVSQCNTLLEHSKTMSCWSASPYGRFIRMSTRHTLSDVRTHWQLYASLHQSADQSRIRALRTQFVQVAKGRTEDMISTAIRSAGPAMMNSFISTAARFKSYWESGTTFDKSRQMLSASLLNPTFVYSLAGEGCNVHYGTDPLIPFHTAALFGNARRKINGEDVVTESKRQFGDWCSAFSHAISRGRVVIRMFSGDAMAFCHALKRLHSTGISRLDIPVAQWSSTMVELDKLEYGESSAPSYFHAIDTSNLTDHLGLLNVLITAIPLLTADGVVYTESLLFKSEDARKELTSLLYMDIMTFSFLVGLAPVDFVSGFSTRCNTHELLGYAMMKQTTKQFQQVTTWRSPSACEVSPEGPASVPSFHPHQLARLLYDMYHLMFEQEDSMKFQDINKSNMMNAIAHSTIIHYSRETFALFLALVRSKLQIDEVQWMEVMDRFFDFNQADISMPMDTLNRHDLSTHLYRYGVYKTSMSFSIIPSKAGRFRSWSTVPLLSRVVLVVPREKLEILKDTGTPPLLAYMRGSMVMNNFNSVHACFGKVFSSGSETSPSVVMRRDPKGWQGNDPLLISFILPSVLFTELESPQSLFIGLAVRSTPGTAKLIFQRKLDMSMHIFEAPLMDKEHVFVIPGPDCIPSTCSSPISFATSQMPLGTPGPALINMDDECELIASIKIHVDVQTEAAKTQLQSTINPAVCQNSPCTMLLEIGSLVQHIRFPFPVVGSKNRLRIARKSSYIEVIVPPSSLTRPEGIKLNQFPVCNPRGSVSLWNVHRLSPAVLPKLDIHAKSVKEWLNHHIGSMMSARERTLRKAEDEDVIMNIKDTIHSIFVTVTGIQKGPTVDLFLLTDKQSNNCDTLLFVDAVRYDLAAHTVVCDGYVLPLTRHLLQQIQQPFGRLIQSGKKATLGLSKNETRGWKHLLPALAERCRTSWRHGENCEYKGTGKIPLSFEMEQDPLCSCGRGKDVDGMLNRELWAPFALHVTRVVVAPLFAVSYLEPVGRDPESRRCFLCRQKAKSLCTGCKMVRYCSVTCQKKDWKSHKRRCQM